MKDGKYEVGDVIAFRWTGKKLRVGEMGDSFTFWDGPSKGESIFCQHGNPVSSGGAFILERITNPKLMEGEWWKGWTWKRVTSGSYDLKRGELYLPYSGNGGVRENIHSGNIEKIATVGDGIIVLVPPPSDPKPLCPELREKIERVEAELAELKKQALGESR